MSVAPTLPPMHLEATSCSHTRADPVTLFLIVWVCWCGSNVPMACSQVYKERNFKAHHVDVLYLTQVRHLLAGRAVTCGYSEPSLTGVARA
jgi:hypothetical protein